LLNTDSITRDGDGHTGLVGATLHRLHPAFPRCRRRRPRWQTSRSDRGWSKRSKRCEIALRTDLPVPGEAGPIAQWQFRLGSAEYLQELLVIDDDGRFDGQQV
jgi:hypothetical protein